MLVTFPSSQSDCPRIDYYEEDPIGLVAVINQNQKGWFTTNISYRENFIETILNPYPLGIHTIANHVHINKLSVSCMQCALFDTQSNRWAFHEVEEIWRWQRDSASENFEYFFRLAGGQGLLDSEGNPVPLEQGDKLELIYHPRLTAGS